MNFSLECSIDAEHINETDIAYSKVSFVDKVDNQMAPSDIISTLQEATSMEKDFILFSFSESDSGQNKFAIYTIKSLTKKGRFYRIVLHRINPSDDDLNQIDFNAGNFCCSRINYIYDIPSGDSVGAINALSAKANVYAQTHQPKFFVDVIKTKDIVTDDTATEQNKKHYFELQHTPIIDELTYMEINGVNYYESADDIEIDRENKRIYFDTQDDDFTFENLQESAETVRVFYKYIPE